MLIFQIPLDPGFELLEEIQKAKAFVKKQVLQSFYYCVR